MKNDLRVVVDTNVLISGLFGITNSPSAQILKFLRNKKFIFLTSPPILEEIAAVINRKRIIKATKMSIAERSDFIENLIQIGDVTPGKQLSNIIARDIKDDKFLACGVEGKADYIISGDDDLLSIKEYKKIKILSPREFLAVLK